VLGKPVLGKPVLGKPVLGGPVLRGPVLRGPVLRGLAGTVSSARTTSLPSPWHWRSSSGTTSALPRWRLACGC